LEIKWVMGYWGRQAIVGEGSFVDYESPFMFYNVNVSFARIGEDTSKCYYGCVGLWSFCIYVSADSTIPYRYYVVP